MPIAKLNDDSEFDALPRGHPQIVISSLTERGSHKMEILGYFQGMREVTKGERWVTKI